MKTLFALLFSIAISSSLFAQSETLFDSDMRHGGYGGPVVKFTSVNGEFGVMVGGYGGWLINGQLMLGGGGYGLVSDIAASEATQKAYYANGPKLYFDMGYGGGIIEFIAANNNLVHFSVHTLIGAGSVQYRTYRYADFDDDYRKVNIDPDAFFVLEPGANVELNVAPWMRTMIGGSYRYVSGINRTVGVGNEDLRGFSGNITFKFGTF